jgi:hypothetical protein
VYSYGDPMSAPAAGIDWDDAERHERRRDLLLAPGLVAFFVGLVLLTGGFAFATGGAAWAVVGALLAFVLLMSAASHLSPRLRARNAPGYRIQAALRLHADPGPGLRSRADQQALYLAGSGWVGWLIPFGPLGVLIGGQWERPVTAATGAVLVVGAAAAGTRWWRGRVRAARRWLADPPGPSREAPTPTRRMRWVTGRRAVLTIVGSSLALGLVIGLGAAVLARS